MSTIPVKQEDYLDIDEPIAGQNYVCLSFISPDDIIKQRELFNFNKYMNQLSKEFEDHIDRLVEKAGDEYNNKITKELKEKVQYHYRLNYDKFKTDYDDFKYKYSDELEKTFNKQTDFKTSVRGVKVRGVFDTLAAAEAKAKNLQHKDSSFHVFVGSIGYWLPWDPCADKVQNEEYMEEQLNTLIHKYKENQVHKDILYEQEKREKIKEAAEASLRQKMESENVQGDLEDEDPWMKSKFAEAERAEAEEDENNDNGNDEGGAKVI